MRELTTGDCMKILDLGGSEFLIYTEDMAGLFSDFRSTANHGIHIKENRKLTESEVEDLLQAAEENSEDSEDSDTILQKSSENEHVFNILDKIIKMYPEVKYLVHGLKKSKRKRIKADPEIDKKKNKQWEEFLADPTVEKKPVEEEKKGKEKKGKEKEEEPEELRDETQEEYQQRKKKAMDEYGEAEKYREAHKSAKTRVEEEEEKVSKMGLDKSKPKGYMDILLDLFKSNKKSTETQKLQEYLRRNWDTYMENKQVVDKNEDLVNGLNEALEENRLDLHSITLMNELIERDPKWVDEIDFHIETPTFTIPLVKFKKYIDTKKDDSDIRKQFKKLFNRKQLSDSDIKVNIDKHKKNIQIETDWSNGMNILELFKLNSKDIVDIS